MYVFLLLFRVDMAFFVKLFLKILSLRYTLRVKGLPKINPHHNYLILPNHVAYIDPIFIWCLLYSQIKLRPVATSLFAEESLVAPLLKLMRTISVDASLGASHNLKKSLKQLTEALKN